MAAILKHWREAATLILVAKGRSQGIKAANTLFNYEILMLKRSSKSKFMPSVYVFPGGVATNSDFSNEWLELFDKDSLKTFCKFWKRGGKGPPMFSRMRDTQFESVESELAFRICAIRETFEESGVLLVKPAKQASNKVNNELQLKPAYGCYSNLPEASIQLWREKVEKDASQFLVMCKELGVVPDVWALTEWSNWLTPITMRTTEQKRQPKRFDTAFFLCILDSFPPAVHDNTETVHSMWSSPDDLLTTFHNAKGILAPPQVYELCRMLNYTTADDLNAFNFKRSGDRVEQYFPVPALCSDGILYMYPGDDQYPQSPDLEGEHYKMLTFPESVAESNNKCKNKNRNTMVNPPHGKMLQMNEAELIVTAIPKDGHALPRTDWSFLNSVPHAKL